jgi:hypothetical protein
MFQQLKLYITDVFYEIKNMFSELKIYITEDLYKIYPPLKIEIRPKSITNTNHKYLRYTNSLIVITLLYFVFNKNKNFIEYILASSLIPTIIFSQFFWYNPIKHTLIHKIDAITAKIVIFSCISYTLLYKYKFSFLIILLAIAISFYFSNYYSNQEWCSNKHIFCHGSGHIFCFIATLYTFSAGGVIVYRVYGRCKERSTLVRCGRIFLRCDTPIFSAFDIIIFKYYFF